MPWIVGHQRLADIVHVIADAVGLPVDLQCLRRPVQGLGVFEQPVFPRLPLTLKAQPGVRFARAPSLDRKAQRQQRAAGQR